VTTAISEGARAPADNLTQSEAERRAELISDLKYEIELHISDDPTAKTFESVSAVTFDVAREGADTFINIAAPHIDAVELNDRSIVVTEENYDGARLLLPGLRRGRNRLRVRARCAYGHTGVGLHRLVDPVDSEVYLYTHFEPFDAHKVFACFDQPDLKGTFAMRVEAPAAWKVCGNARVLDAQTAAGRTTWAFNVTPPIPTYLVAIVAGAFHVVSDDHRGIPLGLWCRESFASYLDDQAAAIFEITKQGLDFFADYFGLDYPFDEYNQLFVPEANMGAMENPGCVTFNEAYIFRGTPTQAQLTRRAETILHEMAHVHGFGDVVTMRWWGDLWLNETFATYMSNLALHEATDFTDGWVDFANTVKSVAARQDQLITTHRIADSIPDTDSVRQNFDGITYHKGASVMRQLAAWVGADAFEAGVQDYFRRYRWGNATLEDFLACIERASGRDMKSWSRQWLETAGMNTLRPVAEVQGGHYTRFAVEQTATAKHSTLRSHRIAVGLYSRAGGRIRRTRRLELDIEGPLTEVPQLIGEPAADLVIVNDDDLTFAKLRFDQRSVPTLLESLSAVDDPLARALCWAALWDMTRDAEFRTRDYVELVARHGPFESEPIVVERVLSQAITAIDQYADPANRPAARARLHDVASEQIARAAHETHLHITWSRCAVATTDRAGDLDRLAAVLAGDASIPGVALDTDLRWLVVARLASAGRLQPEQILAELDRDPTDFGRRHAAASLAGRPTAEAKADAWQLIIAPDQEPPANWSAVVDRPPSLATIAAIMHGFATGAFLEGGFIRPGPEQEAEIRPYIIPYAAAIPRVWAERTVDEAETFTEGLYPRYITDDELVRAVQSVLDRDDLPGGARRILQEGLDGTMRSRRARDTDRAGVSPQPALR